MKQSVDLMNSMKLMNSRHSNTTTTTTTSLARRAFLLLTILSMGVGNVWGAFTPALNIPDAVSKKLKDSGNNLELSSSSTITISNSHDLWYKEAGLSDNGGYVRFYVTELDGSTPVTISALSIDGGRNPVNQGSYGWTQTGPFYNYNQNVTISLGGSNVANAKFLHVLLSTSSMSGDQEPTITAHYVFTIGADPVDTFESELKSGATDTGEYTAMVLDPTTTTTMAIDLSKAMESCTSPVYARFQVLYDDEAVDLKSNTSLLTVTGTGVSAKLPKTGTLGYYVYNAGSALPADLSVTLNATALTFPKYKVVCILSSGAENDELDYDTGTGEVKKEPNWDVKYTYSFKNGFIEIPVTLPFSSLSNAYLQIDKHSDILSMLSTTESEMQDSWYGRWYVRNKENGEVQPLAFGNTQADDVWSVYGSNESGTYKDGSEYNGESISSNYLLNNSNSAIMTGWGVTSLNRIQRTLGYLQVYAPTEFATMQGASDYEIVYEVTDEYTSGTPEFKLRYVFKIPAFENEPNTSMTEDTKPQTVTDRNATSFTLGDMPDNAKYARFYLMDKDDNIIAPSTILSVTSGTACGKAESGIYLYNSGSVLTPTVTIAAPNAYKLYKVVGLFSTALDDINASGTTVNHEPKWDMKYTYTFDYTITTNNQEPQIEWDATAMETDATDTNIDVNWKTSLAELAAGQTIKWWVKDGSNNIQSLAIGTSRQDGTWTIGLPTGFVVASNVATLSGMTSVDAGQLESWVKTHVYAPSDKTYADVHDYKIVCEVYTNNAGTGNPNARYTFSIHKGFVGSLKSTATDATERVLLAASDVSKEISVTLPTGTKYLRAYLTNVDGNPVDPSGKLSITGGAAVSSSVEAYTVNYGSCLYNNGSALTSPATVTLTLDDTKLDEYKVVVVTSKDNAVVTSDYVSSEPDWDGKTTYWFKYPAKATTSLAANVEWSAQSMQITAPDIEATDLGAGYLESNKKHYTLQWSVVDKNGNAQPLYQGSSRVNDYWSVVISGSPFTLSADSKVLTVTNDANLSTSTWTSWIAPVFYAPANKTMKQITDDGIVFVCKFYEDDNATALNDALLSMTYTVYIDRRKQLGKLKDGGKRGGETITTIISGQTEAIISLKDASDAFLAEMTTAPTYARIYLTKSDGTLIDPTDGTEKLTNISGATGFTTKEYGYYLQNESGLTLPNATLTLPADKFNYYYVVVAMSKDTGETGHTGTFARELTNRGAFIESIYEPDYDYIYTIKFKETSTFPGTLTTPHFQHAKEILVSSEDVTELTIPLADNINKIKKELGASTLVELANSFHVRWYLTKRDDSGDYEKIPNSENYLTSVGGTYWKHMTEEDFGLYWNSATGNKPGGDYDAANMLNITVTKPSATDSWEEYRLMIVMSNDLTGQTDNDGDPKKLTHEPNNLNMLYIYNFYLEHEFQFVHDVGESGRPYVTKNGADIDTKDARINATVQQYSWDNSTGSKVAVSEDIRQGVHTVEYDIYVDPTTSTPVSLKLPFQFYYGEGNNLEPAAYIRWYDWNTDINHTRLVKDGSYLEDMQEVNNGSTVSRGFFMLNNSVGGIKPTQDLVGVTFNPNGLNELVTIACDVSKYYDGIYEGSVDDTRAGFSGKKHPYLMHEPTLSTRYIFNIRPASVIATSIQIGQDKLEAGGTDMFQLAEDNGRVSVAMKDASTSFSIRAALSELDYFYINNGSSLMSCNKIAWYAYLEDETGIYRNDAKLEFNETSETQRISRFKVSALNGTYTPISGGGSKSVTAQAGQRFHLVGYIGNNTRMAPVVHYEVNLIDAPAYAVDDLPLERTEAYLRQHMTLQATVDFDGLGGTELSSTLTTQSENHSTEPLPWNEAQYGFCYPDVRRIWANGGNDFMGISPLHGEYMLLRSMNDPGVTSSGYTYQWWNSNVLHDYTYSYGLGLDGRGAAGQYGSFLYVDASDESRTIAQMSFNADLCAGSELCFTGVIADMTGGQVKPQVMSTVYAVKTNGTKVRVVSFHSSNLSTTAAGTYTTGKWYQVYGRVAIPATVDLSNVDHYEVNIDNYSPGTDGADYAVDQLMFYTSNAKLKVKQSSVNCGDAEIRMNLYVSAEDIEHMAGKTIYWRICDKNGNAMTDATLYNNGGLLYGKTTVPASIPGSLPSESSLPHPFSGYFEGTDGVTYFSLANKGFALKEGSDYYISVYNMYETSVTYESLWGNPSNTCSVFSPVFVPKVMYLSVEDGSGNAVTTVTANCSTHEAAIDLKMVLNMPDDREVSGFHKYTGVHYDYFNGTLLEFQSYELDGVTLQAALRNFRGKQKGDFSTTFTTPPGTSYSNIAYASSALLPDDYMTVNSQKYYNVIKKAMDEGLLHLSCSSDIKLSVTVAHPTVTALPIEDQVTYNTKNYGVCSPLAFTFIVSDTGGGPSLVLGFDDVSSYPAGIRVVRVGKEQLKNMQDGDYLLHIPVNTFKTEDSATPKAGALVFVDKLRLLAYSSSADQTNDDQITANVDVATFGETEINNTGKMYVSLNFHDAGITKPVFQEGFTYRMFFQVKKKGAGVGACEGNVEFLLKVVPKYVTWNGANSNWNNDASWQRSTRTELNKGTSAATNTDDYENNGEGTLSTVMTTPKTFVPMKFTYVTIPGGIASPNLVNLTYDTEGIYKNIGAAATENIQYDLMVRYTETTCQNHGVSGSVYDCEKFYGNWAKELYMKPNAELLNQQYLTYEKVWVEKELDANTWTLMSTPLQNTYAGDMYVPVSATAADNGRQTSEAFQPINFSTTTNAAGFTYSRTKYPIYQKGWTQAGVYVKTKTNDIRATQYSANIPGGVSTILNQWSHEYNDVTVPYSTWTAFAIRPHKKDQTAKTLIRLPKADTNYDYYQWDNTSPDDGKLSQTISKETTGKLLTDGTANISGVTYGTVYGSNARTASDGNYNALVANVQSSPANYQLVGNPYLCSINMATFISENAANLDAAAQGYWTYDNNTTGTPIENGYIAPMQSFFVKVKDGATGVVFKPSMMVDGHTVTSAPAREFTLMATNERGASAATVSVGEETKSVETLFDSNLADVPMVYTVADGQAVSINQVKELSKPIAFGVTCTASNEMVDVTFSDIEKLTSGEVYVVDAVDGTSQQIYEGDSYAVQPNDYGRYFLTFTGGSATGIEETASAQQGIVVSVRGREVTVTSGEEISQIQAVSLNGSTIYQNNSCGNSVTFMLHAGVYVIQAKNTAGAQQNVKIFVK